MHNYDFKKFAKSIADQFSSMSSGELYRSTITGDEIWDLYLESFPPGTNEIYRTRKYFDGSYDKSFIRKIGNVVCILPSLKASSIWDADGLEYPFSEVAAVLRKKLRDSQVSGLFRSKESKAGYQQTTELLDNGERKTWNHFHADIAQNHQSSSCDDVLGEANTTASVFKRSLEEMKLDALTEIIELINSKALYRGDEFKPQVVEFHKLKGQYDKLKIKTQKNNWIWLNLRNPVNRFKNTVIGTLAADISDGVDIDRAVSSFEAKVAPTNYKRPTAIITQGMVSEAMKKIAALNLEPALARRHAKLSDVSINNVLWASNSAQPKMKGGIESLLSDSVRKPIKSSGQYKEVSIDQFIKDILPKASEIEVEVKDNHQKNLVSITAPESSNIEPIFKWDNNFAWSYNGNITDAIKERVKAAGGNIQADLRISLAWFNHDDLDLHAECPYGHVYYRNKCGILDVDMNALSGTTRTPVENLAFLKPKNGTYRIAINQYSKRETSNIGFTLEVECNGVRKQFSYNHSVNGTIDAINLTVSNGSITRLDVMNEAIEQKGLSKEVWGIKTEDTAKVSTIMLSPNYWDGNEHGNKHWFFILDGCNNQDPVRGIYNEFLRPGLEPHRKVFEVLGSKTKCQPAGEQLSGLGFSSTVRESINVRVSGQTINQAYTINF